MDRAAAPGDRFGPYEVVSILGQGGMGVVYRARDREGVEVALKLARVRPGSRQALEVEIAALSQVSHPGIVRILDHGAEGGEVWVATELVDGHALRAHFGDVGIAPSGGLETVSVDDLPSIGEGSPAAAPAPWTEGAVREALGVFQHLCVPLAFLHGEGLAHGDLKPENVLVRPDGSVVLVDFGLFRRLGRRETLHATRRVAGTAAYLSPEQCRGRPPDARSDLYAVGCMLYERLVGALPFGRTGHARKRWTRRVEAPSEVVELPADLERVVLSLLEIDPRRRMGYATDLAEALERCGIPRFASPPVQWSLYRAELVGRTRELAEIDAAPVVVVVGDPGSGRTRVLSARSQADRRVPVIGAEAAAPGGLARALLRSLAARSTGPDDARRWFGHAVDALVDLEPALAYVDGVTPAAGGSLPRAARARAVWMAVAAAAPVEVVVDDADQADGLDAEVLLALVRRPPPDVRLVLSAVAGSDGAADLVAAGAVPVALPPLPDEAMDALLCDALAADHLPAELARFVREHACGNPRFAWEYAHMLVREGRLTRREGRWTVTSRDGLETLPVPEGIREVAARRWSALSDAARQAAVAGAVSGRIDARASGTADLVRARFVEVGPDGARFVVPAFRAVALESATPEDLVRLHADALARLPATAPRVERARLLEGAGFPAEAGAEWREACREAAHRRSWTDAMAFARRALALPCDSRPDELEVRILLVAALRSRGRHAEAIEEADRALGRATHDGPVVRRLRVQRARALVRAGDHAGAIEALRALCASSAEDERAQALEDLAEAHAEAGDVSASIDARREVVALRLAGTEVGLAKARVALANALQRQDRCDEAAELLSQALPVLRREGEDTWLAHGSATLGIIAQTWGDSAVADATLDEALALYRRLGMLYPETQVLGVMAANYRRQGRFDLCRARLDEMQALVSELGAERTRVYHAQEVALLQADTGAPGALEALEACARRAQATGNAAIESTVRLRAAALLGDASRHAEAERHLDRACELAERRGDLGGLVEVACQRGHLALATGATGMVELARAEEVLAEFGTARPTVYGPLVQALRDAVARRNH